MSASPEQHLVEIAHARQLADRLEAEALLAAVNGAACQSLIGRQAYALAWLALHAANKIVRLEGEREQAYAEGVSNGKGMARVEDAARAHDAAGPVTPIDAHASGVAGFPPARASRR